MIYIFTQTYFLPLLCISVSALIILCMGLFLILYKNSGNHSIPVSNPPEEHELNVDETKLTSSFTISSKDISAIAGDDVITTQLDLARAYIETGRKQLALKILEHVERKGTARQQQEASNLTHLIKTKHAPLLDDSLQLGYRAPHMHQHTSVEE